MRPVLVGTDWDLHSFSPAWGRLTEPRDEDMVHIRHTVADSELGPWLHIRYKDAKILMDTSHRIDIYLKLCPCKRYGTTLGCNRCTPCFGCGNHPKNMFSLTWCDACRCPHHVDKAVPELMLNIGPSERQCVCGTLVNKH